MIPRIRSSQRNQPRCGSTHRLPPRHSLPIHHHHHHHHQQHQSQQQYQQQLLLANLEEQHLLVAGGEAERHYRHHLEEQEDEEEEADRRHRHQMADNNSNPSPADSSSTSAAINQQQPIMPNGELTALMSSTNGNGNNGTSPPSLVSVAGNKDQPPPMPPPAAGVLQKGTAQRDEVQLRVNVGGRSAQISVDKIRMCGDRSRLAQFAEKEHAQRLLECDSFLAAQSEYYFERSAAVFEHLLDYYVTGRMHRPLDICPIRWRDELEFWRIPLAALADCCRVDCMLPVAGGGGAGGGSRRLGNSQAMLSPEHLYVESSCPPAEFENVRLGRARLVVWTFLENPRSSTSAKSFSFVSAALVLLSLICLILSSMPDFQIDKDMNPVWPIQFTEMSCMLVFTLEYIVRLIVVPRKWSFIKQPLNIIDLMTIVPFLLEAFMPLLGVYDIELRNFRGALVVIRVLRLARVARIFKLARYSIGLRAFGETMRKSAAELSMLGMFLLTGIMLFSTAIYFFERDEPNSKFYSIPSAWWWCVATMTTVGYGDLVPVTTGGKVVAAVASVCGIIVLAFPISMIIDKFAESTGHGQKLATVPGSPSGDDPCGTLLPLAHSQPSQKRSNGSAAGGGGNGAFSPRGTSRRRTKSRRYLF